MALFEYSRWDGSQQFLPQSADRVFDQIAEYLMQHGDRVLENIDQLEDEIPEILDLIQKEGLIEKDKDGQWRVTPRGVRRIEDRALEELFQSFRRDALGRHDTQEKGEGSHAFEDTRPYVYGDSLTNLDLHETLKNAYIRQGGGIPIRVGPDDYVVHETEYQTRCATVVLIDMSGSMGRYGKYYTTKKVALALQAMVRARYPQDSLQMIGFYTFANLMNERQLLGSAPKPVSLFDSRVHMRFDLDHPPGAYPSISPISTPAFAWPGASCRASLLQTSRSSSSPMVNRRRTSKGGKLCSFILRPRKRLPIPSPRPETAPISGSAFPASR